jgi:exopolyphosphatase / guanosine-5'-triphosphate,3'-diphosphate pyrophosphatase
MKVASIDIGTNTILLLIADINKDGNIETLHEEQRIPRLGKDVDGGKIIGKPAFERVEKGLKEYSSIISSYGVEHITACGTSALRDASNRVEFIKHMLHATGISIEILSGADEALWTFKGALSGTDLLPEKSAVLDIGGGSTEISIGVLPLDADESVRIECHSLQLGSVRLTERFFITQPPSQHSIDDAKEVITAQLQTFRHWNIANRTLVGVAGTVTTLTCLELGLMDFDRDKISGYRLPRNVVNKWLEQLTKMTTGEIRSLSNVTEGRADILLAGTLILSEVMRFFKFKEVFVTERGVRYGLALRKSMEKGIGKK